MISLLNIGKFLDISEQPKKADIIVSVGGDRTGYRIKKAYSLYAKNYSKSNKILINPKYDFHAFEYLTEKNISRKNIVSIDNAPNTMSEIRFTKRYMLENGFKRVIIVSDPPHLRRIRLLADGIAGYKSSGIECIVVGSSPPWWNKREYYKNGFALAFAISEMIKIPFNFIKYGILEKLGLYEQIKYMLAPYEHEIKKIYQKMFIHLWKIHS